MAICAVTPADDYFNFNGHALKDGDRIWFSAKDAGPTGFSIETWYYVCSADARAQNDKFKIETSIGGGALPIGGSNGNATYTTLYSEPEYVIAQPWNDPLDPEREGESSGDVTPPVTSSATNSPMLG